VGVPQGYPVPRASSCAKGAVGALAQVAGAFEKGTRVESPAIVAVQDDGEIEQVRLYVRLGHPR
jgi:hypothetical protein